MKWFTIAGVKEEVRKIQWPSSKETRRNTVVAVSFILFFVAYFILTEFVLVWALRLLGIGA